MSDKKLVQYIQDQLEKGFSVKVIDESLLSRGYPADIINASINEALNAMHRQPDTNNAEPELTAYFKQLMGQGYSPDKIKNFLLSRGYPLGRIEACYETINPASETRRTDDATASKSSIPFVIIILIGLGLLGFGAYMLFSGFDSGKKALDFSIEVSDKNVEQGSILYFTEKLTNMGSKKSYNVNIEHSITDKKTNEEIDSWTNTAMVGKVQSINQKREIGQDIKPGEYIIRGVINYGSEPARAFDTFHVITGQGGDDGGNGEGSGDDGEDGGDSEDDEEPTGLPSCSDNIKNQGEEDIDCGGPCSPCEPGQGDDDGEDGGSSGDDEDNRIILDTTGSDMEKISQVEALGTMNPDESEQLCSSVEQKRRKDDCYLKLSNIFNSSSYCLSIESDSKKDVCYMYFVNQHDFTVCDNIINPYIKRSCQSLKQINSVMDESSLPTEESAITDPLQYPVPDGNISINSSNMDPEENLSALNSINLSITDPQNKTTG
ncbi:hypothetical protein JXB31_00550 [Candidatus Woesearchaeota archaeon]|nr:hypothetical protein [Candidatus Woesearchaeota archaeon]